MLFWLCDSHNCSNANLKAFLSTENVTGRRSRKVYVPCVPTFIFVVRRFSGIMDLLFSR